MTYAYEERMRELSSIDAITDQDNKIKLLELFITEEEEILNQLKPPHPRSQALDAARNQLHALQNPSQNTHQSPPRFFLSESLAEASTNTPPHLTPKRT